MEYWSVGVLVLEYWSNGVLGNTNQKSNIPSLLFPSTPSFHYSSTPYLYYSITPLSPESPEFARTENHPQASATPLPCPAHGP